jgi:hypothetical protein
VSIELEVLPQPQQTINAAAMTRVMRNAASVGEGEIERA